MDGAAVGARGAAERCGNRPLTTLDQPTGGERVHGTLIQLYNVSNILLVEKFLSVSYLKFLNFTTFCLRPREESIPV